MFSCFALSGFRDWLNVPSMRELIAELTQASTRFRGCVWICRIVEKRGRRSEGGRALSSSPTAAKTALGGACVEAEVKSQALATLGRPTPTRPQCSLQPRRQIRGPTEFIAAGAGPCSPTVSAIGWHAIDSAVSYYRITRLDTRRPGLHRSCRDERPPALDSGGSL